jgi:O-antigen/teichoic acid export membrane protein
MLSPADIGAAAAVLLVLTMLEMGTDCVAEEVLITADGDLDVLQATVHGMRMLRSCLLAMVGAAAGLVAAAVHPSAAAVLTWPVWTVGVLLLAVRALANADVERQVRCGRYRSYVILQVVPQVAAMAAAFPLAGRLGGAIAVLIGALTQSAVTVALSHICAERPYRLALDRGSMRRVYSFGVPVLFNGLLLFGLMHGDRVLVGTLFGTATLGIYTVAAGLTLVPTLVLARVNAALLLPALSRAKSEGPAQFKRAARESLLRNGVVVGAVTFGWALAGDAVVGVVYGQKYADAGHLVPMLALVQSMFVLRDLHGIVAMAAGDARHPLGGNGVRVAGLAMMVPAAWLTHGAAMAIGAALGAEAVAYLVSGLRLGRRFGVAAGAWGWPLGMVVAAWWVGKAIGWACTAAGASTLVVLGVLTLGAILSYGYSQYVARWNVENEDQGRSEDRTGWSAQAEVVS